MNANMETKVGQLNINYLIDGSTSGGVGMFELAVPPGPNVPPPHSHSFNEECVYVCWKTNSVIASGKTPRTHISSSRSLPLTRSTTPIKRWARRNHFIRQAGRAVDIDRLGKKRYATDAMNELKQLKSLGLVLPSPTYIFGAIVFGMIGYVTFHPALGLR